mmetsp:Transcript_16849/g.27976  ORF Transcript_16849/g.27976 Transcript_16849/m.27976 type:complete len:243 (+) Transcript_16849:92-820(+)|eukprot:CAMPEP_0119011580 /NCGR_PEP_ID=MMETSP1176-20130426/5765_1 /TAXON_ID=265551 /ORGANISM="Synedropsis recta cf, Strain CCMP1620" /LENGTH=242 /DNA_ID=CAMNT_0006964429 /DNA_START=72 /DNA_END=800 /DNA_ORIENTATION=-
MMKHSLLLIVLALARYAPSLAFTAAISNKRSCFLNHGLGAKTRLFLATPDGEEPFFQMQETPTATTTSRLDHVVDCAENGFCDVEEMSAMIEELEKLNAECKGTTSGECNLDAVAARNVLKVALASKVLVEQVMHVDEECDFAAMSEMHDECLNDMHAIPTAAMKESNLERIVQCSEAGDCPVGEMAEMIEELERLNLDCGSTISRECSLDATEARNILKVALGTQAAMVREVEARRNLKKG